MMIEEVVTNPFQKMADDFAALKHDNEIMHLKLEENLAQRIIALDDVGWTRIFGDGLMPDEDSGPTIEQLNSVIGKLRPEAATNPLHIRGAQLRHSYVFGRGVYFTDVPQKVKDVIANPYNKQALFSVQAYETNNKTLFTDGNLIVLRDEVTNVLSIVPFTEISAVFLDPDDNAKIRYIKRSWSSNGKPKELWYPLSRFKNSRVGRGKRRSQTGGINKSITVGGKSTPVAQDTVAYVHTSNRQSGWTFGLPDSLGALVWSSAYKAYLADNATLVKALSQLAWKVSAATKTGADNAAAAVKVPGTGGTAVVGSGTDVTAVSRGSDVNFNNGQPLAAMVATSFGVPVIALLSSPGATGGSYGAATTLDTPTIKGMKAIQDSWIVFYQEILSDLGAPEALVWFPNISQDETYREVQSLTTAYEAGAISQEEYRQAILDLLDVQKLSDELPVAPELKTLAAQGKTGAVPGGQDQNVGNHDSE
jgi:hypothetical protein